MANFYETVLTVLKSDERFVAEDGTFLRNAVYEAAMKMDEGLIRLLLTNDETRTRFFVEVDGVKVFDKMGFAWIINNRQFLPDSYTRFKNKIGLADETGALISASGKVELVFPYKDCVLEGGQTKEEQKRSEIFYNETLAPDEVDRLLFPKALVSATRFTAQGKEDIVEFTNEDNLIINGNNLLALASLLKRFEGQVKCIYIDPPYNTGSDGFNYNDSFNHSSWLVFMKNRLELARRLLSNDGTIWITLDDVENHYLKVLCDDIFTRDCFVTEVEWQHSDNSNNNALTFSEDVNHILVYSKKPNWKPKFLNDPEKRKHFKNPDNDPKGPWFDGNPVNNPGLRPNLQFDIIAPNGNVIKHPANGWRWSKETMDEKFATGELRFSDDCTRVIRRTYLCDMEGLPPSNHWTNFDITGHTRKAKYELKSLFPGIPVTSLFATPKPELLINYIFDLATNPGDIVLDFFLGSGTTCAVAHKKQLRYIGIEQMEYIHTFVIPRLEKVIAGEQGGISQTVGWQGGGSFVYCELAKLNQTIVEEIEAATDDATLSDIYGRMVKSGFISYKVNPADIDAAAEDYAALSLDDKKRFLMEILDKNLLYVNYCDIDDEEFGISDEDKAFTRSFYREG
ncbi:MAG: site-specific DNA-methyltransferase [[Eubacterium] siraeum]|uniref:DNA methyltransferase n=1 Tax=[Ruminococcus] torques TaxID=33039 RepID=UPI001D0747DE|nr:site-specific DNA-methyltransferase [[Ruminococcus] torques]MBS6321208.1 site-specific DNA-methyltransferase [[Eubacterium] siraeum]MCB5893166.1 site-specific DNA-methyltransferase [Faecalicatena fissicatena]MCG4838777.1 site-specific DNA-methyltransferase [[Ruminococcus] torques]MDE8704890.1 site-specific DNA-methyltransferase [[Ruminococcus] torques]